MKNSTIHELTNGEKIEQAVKLQFPRAHQNAVSLLVIELKGLIGPVIYGLNTEVKEWEREAADARDDAGYAWSEVEELEKDIERMEYEQERQEMLKQFYSY